MVISFSHLKHPTVLHCLDEMTRDRPLYNVGEMFETKPPAYCCKVRLLLGPVRGRGVVFFFFVDQSI